MEAKKKENMRLKNHHERLTCHGVGKILTKNTHTRTHARVSVQYLLEKIFKNDTKIINQSLSILRCNCVVSSLKASVLTMKKKYDTQKQEKKCHYLKKNKQIHSRIIWMFFNLQYFETIVFFVVVVTEAKIISSNFILQFVDLLFFVLFFIKYSIFYIKKLMIALAMSNRR